jgi:DnaJ-class molecular chaperone
MAYHSFSVDPRTVLGVGPDASPDEMRDAYHAKSKKHHPDLGGDEWAFRMVARAYEVLKTTADNPSADLRRTVANGGQHGYAPDWSGIWNPRFNNTGSSSTSSADAAEWAKGSTEQHPDLDDDETATTVSPEAQSRIAEPDEL